MTINLNASRIRLGLVGNRNKYEGRICRGKCACKGGSSEPEQDRAGMCIMYVYEYKDAAPIWKGAYAGARKHKETDKWFDFEICS